MGLLAEAGKVKPQYEAGGLEPGKVKPQYEAGGLEPGKVKPQYEAGGLEPGKFKLIEIPWEHEIEPVVSTDLETV